MGVLGIFGNLLTLAVLNRSKGTNFNQLLGVLAIIDMLLIVCFILMSACTTGSNSSIIAPITNMLFLLRKKTEHNFLSINSKTFIFSDGKPASLV